MSGAALRRAGQWPALAAIVAAPLSVLLAIAKRGVNVPAYDEWEWADMAFRLHHGLLTFGDVWAQHNEHRNLFANLMFLGFERIGGWDVVREEYFAVAVLALGALALWRLIAERIPGTRALVVFAACSATLFSLVQWENFSLGYNVGWEACTAAVLAVTYLLTRRARAPRDVLLAVLAATVASFSSGQGLVAWPVGLVAIVLTGRDRVRTGLLWLVAAALVIGVYYTGWHPYDSGGSVSAAAHPRLVASYALAYLGAPLAGWAGPAASVVAGTALVLALALFAWADLRPAERGARLVRAAPWYALAAYPLASALVTAASRAGLGLEQAITSRYTAIAQFIVLALIGLIATRLRSTPGRARPMQAVAVAAACVFLYAYDHGQRAGNAAWRAYAADRRAELAGLAAGSADLTKLAYPEPYRLRRLLRELRAIDDGPFVRASAGDAQAHR